MIPGKVFHMPLMSCTLLRRSPAYVLERMESIMCSGLTGENNLEPPALHLHRLLTPSLLYQLKALQGTLVDRLTPVDCPILEVRLTHLLMESQVLEEESRKLCLECVRSMPPMCMR